MTIKTILDQCSDEYKNTLSTFFKNGGWYEECRKRFGRETQHIAKKITQFNKQNKTKFGLMDAYTALGANCNYINHPITKDIVARLNAIKAKYGTINDLAKTDKKLHTHIGQRIKSYPVKMSIAEFLGMLGFEYQMYAMNKDELVTAAKKEAKNKPIDSTSKLYEKLRRMASTENKEVRDFLDENNIQHNLTPQLSFEQFEQEIGKYADKTGAIDELPKELETRLRYWAYQYKETKQGLLLNHTSYYRKGNHSLPGDYIKYTQTLFDKEFGRKEGEVINLKGLSASKNKKHRKLYARIINIRLKLNDDTTKTVSETITNYLTGYTYEGVPTELENIPEKKLVELMSEYFNKTREFTNSEKEYLYKHTARHAASQKISTSDLYKRYGFNVPKAKKTTTVLSKINPAFKELTGRIDKDT